MSIRRRWQTIADGLSKTFEQQWEQRHPAADALTPVEITELLARKAVSKQAIPKSIVPKLSPIAKEYAALTPLLQRLEGAAVVPPTAITLARTYREAVRLCWQLRRIKWTPSALAMAFSRAI